MGGCICVLFCVDEAVVFCRCSCQWSGERCRRGQVVGGYMAVVCICDNVVVLS